MPEEKTKELQPDLISEQKNKLAAAQLRLALNNMLPNHWIMPLAGLAVCAVFSNWVPLSHLAAWWVLIVLSLLPLAAVSRKFNANDSGGIGKWMVLGVSAYLAGALGWSSLCFFLWAPGNDMDHMLVFLVLGGTLAGASAVVSASNPMRIVAFVVYGGLLLLTPLRVHTSVYNSIAAIFVIYIGFLFQYSRTMYATSRDMLLLRDDKDELIAALAKSTQESESARQQAEAANRAKSQFLANMSHELRTPLNAILGFSQIIESGMSEATIKKHGEYAGIIRESGNHLLALINDVLDLAKIESGKLELNETDWEIADLVADCVSIMRPKAQSGGVRLETAFTHGLPVVHADERAMKQVLLNLLSNAVKFTPYGGQVTVFANRTPAGEIAFGVTDTGIGIAQDDQERVFETFGQARHDITIAERGTGLGLPIVKGLVEAHDGTLVLQSRLGEGTTVTVTLPAKRTRNVPLRLAS